MPFNEEEVKQQALDLANQLNQGVDTAYSAGLANMQQQKALLPQEYNPYRDSARLQNRLDTKTLNEQMANIGLTQSGTNLTAQTALKTSNQKTMNSINSAEQKALRELTAQINQYIGERDAAKQTNLANSMGRAQDTINQYKSSYSLNEQNQTYQQANLALENDFRIQNANLTAQLNEAQAQRDFARTSQLEREMADIRNTYDINRLNLEQQYNVENDTRTQGFTRDNAIFDQKNYVINQTAGFKNAKTEQDAKNLFDRETDRIKVEVDKAAADKNFDREKELKIMQNNLDKSYASYTNDLKASSQGGGLSTDDQKAIATYTAGLGKTDMHIKATELFKKYSGVDKDGNIISTPAFEYAMQKAGMSNWNDENVISAIASMATGGYYAQPSRWGLMYRSQLQNKSTYSTKVDDITYKKTRIDKNYVNTQLKNKYLSKNNYNYDFYSVAMLSAGLTPDPDIVTYPKKTMNR